MLGEKMKKKIYNIMPLIVILLLSACSSGAEKNVPVAGEEQQSTTEKSSETEYTTTEQPTEESTIPDSQQSTSDVTTESVTQPTTEEPTTTKQEIATNYIYEHISDDTDKVKAFGDVNVAEAELAELTELLKTYGSQISFKAVSVDGTKGISYNSDGEYFAASAIKAPYLLYCYQQMDAGNGTLDEEMTYTSKYYRDGTGDIKNSADGTVYTLEEIMRRVIWNSDNSGYYMCADRWGKDGYNQLMEQIGADRLKFPSHSIWVYDVRVDDFIIAWKGIYDYFETNTEHAKKFYDSTTNCKWSFFGSGIKDSTIAQKYGWTDDSYSDAGIVYGENGTYLLAVFTNSAGEDADRSFVAKIVNRINEIMD